MKEYYSDQIDIIFVLFFDFYSKSELKEPVSFFTSSNIK